MKSLFFTIPILAWKLKVNLIHFLLLYVQFVWFIVTRKIIGTTGSQKISVSFQQRRFALYLRQPMDIAVLREIYIEGEYEWCPVLEPKVIVDLGAHFGDTALYYHARFPEAKIIAVEPAPDNFARLIENTKGIVNIVPVQAAVSDHNGELILHVMPSSLGNSLAKRPESTDTVKVPAMTLETLFTAHHITTVDLLKFDIEGAEFTVFRNNHENHHIKSYIGEVHEDLGNDTIDGFKKMFTERQVVAEQLKNQKRYIVKIT